MLELTHTHTHTLCVTDTTTLLNTHFLHFWGGGGDDMQKLDGTQTVTLALQYVMYI